MYDLCLSTTTGRGTDSLITGSAAGLTGATDLKHPTDTQVMTDTVTWKTGATDLKHPTYIYTHMMTDTVLNLPTNTRYDDIHCYMEERVELLIK